MSETRPDHRIGDARRLMQDGKPVEARALLNGLKQDAVVSELRACCQDMILRKWLRQAKIDAFAAEAGGDVRFGLALARMRGAEGLTAFAGTAPDPMSDQELASWNAGELRAGLLAMRKRPGWQAVAEGWLLLMRGDALRAKAAFAQGRGDQPRRSALGEGVASAVADTLAEAEQLLRGIGPLPQSVYPQYAELLRTVNRHAAGWHAGLIHEVMRSGVVADVERALAACPTSCTQERGWLFLRLGDLKAAANPAATGALDAWRHAAGHWPALLADSLKRLFWWDMEHHCELTPHLASLHAHLLKSDALVAREALMTVMIEIGDAQIRRIDGPYRKCLRPAQALESLSAEWLLVWARANAHALRHDARTHFASPFHVRTKLPKEVKAWKHWKPVIARLMDEFPADRQVITLRMGLCQCLKLQNELRSAIFAAVIHDPQLREELLPRWCTAAEADRRGRKSALIEAAQLEALFAGDVRVVTTHLLLAEGEALLRSRLLTTLTSDHAAFVAWTLDHGPLPVQLVGRDETLDHMLIHWVATRRPECRNALGKALRANPGRYQRQLMELGTQDVFMAHADAKRWRKAVPRCWQANYTVGHLCGLVDPDNYERAHFWRIARTLAPTDAPERAEMDRLLAQCGPPPEFGEGFADDIIFQEMAKLARKMGMDFAADDQDQAPARARNQKRPKVAVPPSAPLPIDLERVAAAAGCSMELGMAGLHVLCALTRAGRGHRPYPPASVIPPTEKSDFLSFAAYVMPHITNRDHRDWLQGLVDSIRNVPVT